MRFINAVGIVVLVALLAIAGYLIVTEKEADAVTYDSGEAVVEDLNTFLKDTIGDDFITVTYTPYNKIDIVVDPAYFSELSADTAAAKAEAFELVKKYSLIQVDGVVYVKEGLPNLADAVAGMFTIAATAIDNFSGATPGVVDVYTTSDVTIVKKGLLPFIGTVTVKVLADQKTIDFAEYILQFVDVDPETQTIAVNIEAFGIDDASSIKDIIGDLKSVPADEFFDSEYSDMINTIIDKANRMPNAVDMISFSWEKDGKTYKAAVDGFQPGETGDDFQKFMAGLYDNVSVPAGYSDGWDVPVSDFKDPETGEYVFDGQMEVIYVGDGGDVYEAYVPVTGNVSEGERDYPVNINAPEHGTIILKPGISKDKVSVKVDPEDGYELQSLTVTMNGKTEDITETMYFTLTGDATLDAVFVKRVTGIDIDFVEATVEVGTTVTIKATVFPSDATNKNVIWTSSNTGVATVDGGVVTTLAVGEAIITATTEDGGYSAQCKVTVNAAPEPPAPVKVTGVKLSANDVTLKVGNSMTLTAVVIPDDATDKGVTWKVDKPSIVTVNNGTIKAVAAGAATVMVTTNDGGFTDTCTVTVTAEPAPSPSKDNTLLYVGIAIAIIVILLIAYLVLSKRKS
ncbi:MAG: Ig domain-containing protein [Candidatus Methanomethylophilaceae archaeon]|nr:Ig domain-containing protein [Candidatus Methanomethylophilaceae archaeon]